MSQYVQGQARQDTSSGGFNTLHFQIQRALQGINTAEPVRVVSVEPGEAGPAGMVSVRPLVNLVDGSGKGIEQSELYALPYLRVQGGENALIIDPKPGDVGLAVYAMRDTEVVKMERGKAPVNPGSARTYNKGDGFYLGGFLNATPRRYVMVADDGITLDDGEGGKLELKGGKLTVSAPSGIEFTSPYEHHNTPVLTFGDEEGGAHATMNGDISVRGTVTSTEDQIAGGISQMTHVHGDVEPGAGQTGAPV